MESSPLEGNAPHYGVNTISSDDTLENVVYKSEKGGEDALVAQTSTSTVNNITVEKSGDADNSDAIHHGTNAAVYVEDATTITINGGRITTSGKNAHGIYAFGTSMATFNDLSIETSSDNSNGVVASKGATIYGNNLNITTRGRASSPIYCSDGYIAFSEGTYTSYGVGSPTVYSSGNVRVENAKLDSHSAEGAVIEGYHNTIIVNTSIFSTDREKTDYSDTSESILVHKKSEEGGRSVFQAEESAIVTDAGNHIFVDNNDTDVFLNHTLFLQNDAEGAFLVAKSSAVDLYADNQDIIGNIIVDGSSFVSVNLSRGYFKGTIKGEGKKELYLTDDAVMVLTEDTHVDFLQNWTDDYSNIYSNGYKFYIEDQEIAINAEAAPESMVKYEGDFFTSVMEQNNNRDTGMPVWGWFTVGGGILILAAAGFCIFRNKFGKKARKKAKQTTKQLTKPTASVKPAVPAKSASPRSAISSSTAKPISSARPVMPSAKPVAPTTPKPVGKSATMPTMKPVAKPVAPKPETNPKN